MNGSIFAAILVCFSMIGALAACGPEGESKALSLKQRMHTQEHGDSEKPTPLSQKTRFNQLQPTASPTPFAKQNQSSEGSKEP